MQNNNRKTKQSTSHFKQLKNNLKKQQPQKQSKKVMKNVYTYLYFQISTLGASSKSTPFPTPQSRFT